MMLVNIEEAIMQRLETAGLNVREFDIQSGAKGLQHPAVYLSIEEGDFKKGGQTKLQCKPTVVITMVFKHLRDEKARRHGIYPILEGVVACLSLQSLDLDISPLMPGHWHNVTDGELAGFGLLAYQIEFQTEYSMPLPAEKDAADLLRIGLDYYRDDRLSAEDEVVLEEGS